MDDAIQQRPSKRSKPISALIPKSENELNISKSKQNLITPGKSITKEKLYDFHNSSSSEKELNKKKIRKVNFPISTPTKKLALSEIKTPLSFKIKEDTTPITPSTPKIPISTLTPNSSLKPTVEQSNEKIPLQIFLDKAQDQPFKEVPILKNDSSSTSFSSINLNNDTDSLLYQAQLPFIHINSWYKVVQPQILNNFINPTHVIISFEIFSDCLIFVICQNLSNKLIEKALLINYRQHPFTNMKINKMGSGSKISLIEGIKIMGSSFKLYKNWKLLQN